MDLQNKTIKSPPYQIVESPEFAQQFAALVQDPKLRDELQRSFELQLPVDPEHFFCIPGTPLRFANIATPPLTLFFTVKDRRIVLIDIQPFA